MWRYLLAGFILGLWLNAKEIQTNLLNGLLAAVGVMVVFLLVLGAFVFLLHKCDVKRFKFKKR